MRISLAPPLYWRWRSPQHHDREAAVREPFEVERSVHACKAGGEREAGRARRGIEAEPRRVDRLLLRARGPGAERNEDPAQRHDRPHPPCDTRFTHLSAPLRSRVTHRVCTSYASRQFTATTQAKSLHRRAFSHATVTWGCAAPAPRGADV